MKKLLITIFITTFFISSNAFSQTQKIGRLGNGYKGAKWGMSPQKVKDVLQNLTLKNEDKSSGGDTYLTFTVGDSKELTCWFYQNKLYYVQFEPISEDGDDKGVQAVLIALNKKYGTGKNLTGYVGGLLRVPLFLVVWDDGISEIKLRMWDPKEVFAKLGYGTYPSSTLKILYTSKKIKSLKERTEKEEKLRKEKEERNKKLKNIEGDI